MKTKDVNNILDIPEIEKHLESIFTLNVYDTSDNLLIYSHQLGDNLHIDISLMVNNTPYLVGGEKKLSDIILIEDIGYFEFNIWIGNKVWCSEYGCYMSYDDDVLQSYCFRPFVTKEDKTY